MKLRLIQLTKDVLIMGQPISKQTKKELERYDYLRAEYFEKSSNLPYRPRPLNNYERKVGHIMVWVGCYTAKTYADIPLSDLYKMIEEKGFNQLSEKIKFIKDKLLRFKGKNFSKEEVLEIFKALQFIYIMVINTDAVGDDFGKDTIATVDDEEKSVLGCFHGSDYYNNHKDELSKKYGDLKCYYFDRSDILLFYNTISLMPKYAEEELENRKRYLVTKKSRDYSDFMRLRKKMTELYKAGKFEQGDKLLEYYSYYGDGFLNGVARSSYDLTLPSTLHSNHEYTVDDPHTLYKGLKGKRILDEDLFLKTVLELSELRDRLKTSKIEKTEDIKYLYRGLVLQSFLRSIQGQKPPEDWLNKKDFEKSLYNDVIRYLNGKTSIDPAALSTSKDENVAKDFIVRDLEKRDLKGVGVLLVIDIADYNKGQDMTKHSKFKEEEVLLPPRTKLKIKSACFKKCFHKGKPINYCEIQSAPE